MRNMGLGGWQECKNISQFYCRYCIEKAWDCLIGIPLPSRVLLCLQHCLLVCMLEKLISDVVGFHYVASLRIDV